MVLVREFSDSGPARLDLMDMRSGYFGLDEPLRILPEAVHPARTLVL
jgi:hypothetical protein